MKVRILDKKQRRSIQQALAIQPADGLAANNLAYLLPLEHGGNATVALTLAQTAR